MMNEEIRECLNCRHEKVSTLAEPCCTCIKKGRHVNWESTTTIVKKEEEKSCVNCRHSNYESPCGYWESTTTIVKKEEEKSFCENCFFQGPDIVVGAPCNDCSRIKKDLFKAKPKQLVKRTYYFTSWQGRNDEIARPIGHFCITDKNKVYKPENTPFKIHSIEIEEEE